MKFTTSVILQKSMLKLNFHTHWTIQTTTNNETPDLDSAKFSHCIDKFLYLMM